MLLLSLAPRPPLLSFPANSISSFTIRKPHRSVRAAVTSEVDSFTEKSGYLFDLTAREADSLIDYDVKKIAAIYRRKPLILLRRLFQIGTTFGMWFGARYLDSYTEKADQMFQIRAAQLRKILLEMGPAYIKIAQAVSSRPDLIPPSYIDELALLQDRITPFSTELAISTIEQELGLPIDTLFSEISPEPVAAASLGQVYQARLRNSGKVVPVKVQRHPGVLKKAGKFNSDLQAVVDEWASSLFREMDYVKEANNGLKFLYGGIEDVKVPDMYMEHTTRRVLVMEWVEGCKLSEVKDLYLVEVGVYCSFNQLLEKGFYHADPHPGNLLRTYDGKLAYLDFGMMGEFKQELRDGFIAACLHLVNRDFGALANDFVTLGLLPPTANKEAVTKALTGVFQNAVAKGVRNISFGDLLGNLGTTMYKFKFQIPSYFSLVIRSLAVLEGIALNFDPNYKVLGSTYPWIARKVLTDSSEQLRSSFIFFPEGVFQIDRLESLLSRCFLFQSLRAQTKRSLVKRNTKETESKVVIKQILSFTLAEKGDFVREILLQEVAKGLDALGLATLHSFASTATATVPFMPNFSFASMTDEDEMNLRTLRRLMLLLSRSQKNPSPTMKRSYQNKNRNTYSEEASLLVDEVPSIQEILPVLSAIPELPPEMQQQLLTLPANLVGRLISRAAARTIRRIFL
ncbi:hypothetical protein K2173_002721 [Erythroxylum novogranatense]|uniref:ABC1 atypical kinase-like domain-containing protein n=1 Tax=Erythroxylum novogranatense TaxID=1862640 RepID=A0AAV8TR41_9ROSI|nr:hypothetical protein K2173_002721 [Erythroxylum novogranatense]